MIKQFLLRNSLKIKFIGLVNTYFSFFNGSITVAFFQFITMTNFVQYLSVLNGLNEKLRIYYYSGEYFKGQTILKLFCEVTKKFILK